MTCSLEANDQDLVFFKAKINSSLEVCSPQKAIQQFTQQQQQRYNKNQSALFDLPLFGFSVTSLSLFNSVQFLTPCFSRLISSSFFLVCS